MGRMWTLIGESKESDMTNNKSFFQHFAGGCFSNHVDGADCDPGREVRHPANFRSEINFVPHCEDKWSMVEYFGKLSVHHRAKYVAR